MTDQAREFNSDDAEYEDLYYHSFDTGEFIGYLLRTVTGFDLY